MPPEYGSSAEGFFARHRNSVVLAGALFAQIVGLAAQVKRPVDAHHPDSGSVRLIRMWTVAVLTPFERAIVSSGHSVRGFWSGYVDLHAVHEENKRLRQENQELKLQQALWNEDASQAHRLQALVEFKEHFIHQTLPAQVIGSSGTELSRVLYLDRGSRDGVKPDMAVITPDGIVGKIARTFSTTSQVLMITDPTSGVGGLLETSRLHGIIRGTAPGDVALRYIMQEETVQKGERVVTSGGDRIFPKGLQIGAIRDITRGGDGFYNLTVTPAANLNRLEEVLVVTQISNDSLLADSAEAPQRAAELLAKRLPTVKKNPANELKDEPEKAVKKPVATPVADGKTPPTTPVAVPKPAPAQAKADEKQEQPVR
ncbi:MAG TPA: rod shape-determining protein MreC [Terriglobales bacterium]|nr:rod shape-determining protein MreC [Terriglobales bacterium]